MGCLSCGTGNKTSGCRNNGGCATGGCNKLNVFDWLSHMELPGDGTTFNVVEVRFKNGRKEFYRNPRRLELHTGDAVVIEVPNGYHIGTVSLQGPLVRLQMRKKNVKLSDGNVRKLIRLATDADLQRFEEARNREAPTLYRTREIIKQSRLKMKLSDVEFQADHAKATFFYSAEERVDFRQLIRALATEFRVRIEMRQISLRQEAGRLGGIGSCGRELCCSTWLTSFRSVSTSAARYQSLSLNPSKLSGQCGRLKCCLNYELDTYLNAIKEIPRLDKPLKTEGGDAYLQKTDIFRRLMWFSYKGETDWYVLPVERVRELLALNAKKQLAPALRPEAQATLATAAEAAPAFDAPLAMDTDRMDEKYREKNPKRRRPKRRKKKRPSDGKP